MGQITIEIPTKTSRRYLIEDRKLASNIITALEESAVRLPHSALSEEEREYAADVKSVKKAVAEFVKTGQVRPLAEFKAELGL